MRPPSGPERTHAYMRLAFAYNCNTQAPAGNVRISLSLPMFKNLLIVLVAVQLARAHQTPLAQSDEFDKDTEKWTKKYGKQIDQAFSGPLAFSHLTYTRCLEERATLFDIGILGMPFDTATTYRPGARFGPFAIRSGSRRQRELRGYTLPWGMDPFALGAKIIDCGDVSSSVDRISNTICSECRCLSIHSTMHWR